MRRSITIHDLYKMKREAKRISALTAYDYTSAQIVDRAGVPLILVGDSLGMVMLGQDTTVRVTLDEMVHHTKATVKGAKRAMVVADLPFLTYQISETQALENAGRLMSETGCKAVKLEGGKDIAPTVRRLVDVGIPVLGHIGYTPQFVHLFGRSRVQGKTWKSGLQLVRDAKALEAAGAFAVVLELVPMQLAGEITRRLEIPTIGIGSGVNCDGEIQVFHDVFGLYNDFTPKHTKRFVNLAETLTTAVKSYKEEVECRVFPGVGQSVSMDAEAINKIRAQLDHENNNPAKAIAVV